MSGQLCPVCKKKWWGLDGTFERHVIKCAKAQVAERTHFPTLNSCPYCNGDITRSEENKVGCKSCGWWLQVIDGGKLETPA